MPICPLLLMFLRIGTSITILLNRALEQQGERGYRPQFTTGAANLSIGNTFRGGHRISARGERNFLATTLFQKLGKKLKKKGTKLKKKGTKSTRLRPYGYP